MMPSAILSRIRNACRRRAARWTQRRPFNIVRGQPLVSFTFDDFPRSALLVGGKILENSGAAGTFYASLGLAGKAGASGEYFRHEDLSSLLDAGHELGCHTFGHCAAWETPPAEFDHSVTLNAKALQKYAPDARFWTLSYPISYPRPATKSRVGRRFACCRGGGQNFNSGTVDLNYVSSFFLEQSPNLDAIEHLLAENVRAGGWLVFSTHEISDRPTRFGCTPEFFDAVVARVAASGARVLPVYRALEVLNDRANPKS